MCSSSETLPCADLKKTVAVLLENVIDRVNSLEQRLKQLTAINQSSASSHGVLRPVESLVQSPFTTANGNSVSAQGTSVIELFILLVTFCLPCC